VHQLVNKRLSSGTKRLKCVILQAHSFWYLPLVHAILLS